MRTWLAFGFGTALVAGSVAGGSIFAMGSAGAGKPALPDELGVVVTDAAVHASAVASAPESGPRVAWDWTMPPGIVDKHGWDFDSQKLAGPPDGLPDRKMKPFTDDQGQDYDPAGNGRYGAIPADGRHEVVLDGSATTGTGRVRCTWRVYSTPKVLLKNVRCGKKHRVRIPEGNHQLRLKATDRTGTTRILSRIKVKNTLIALMGDSYAASSGFNPYRVGGVTGPDSEIDFDEPGCGRTRWAGYVRAATAVEAADPRSNVTLVDVACGGAQVGAAPPNRDGGILTWQDSGSGARPAQVDQVNAIVGDRKVDLVLLLIGGNDAGFGGAQVACYGALSGGDRCYDSIKEGVPLWRWSDNRLLEVDQRFQNMAPCLSPDAPGVCRTAKTLGGPLVPSRPLNINKAERVIQSAYPQLTTRAKKPDEQGDGSADWIHCTFRPTPSQPDASDTYNEVPLMPWDGDWVTRAVYEGHPGLKFVPDGSPDPNAAVGPLRSLGLNPLIERNHTEYGFTVTSRMYDESRTHGPCATAPGMEAWINGVATAAAGAPQDQAKGGSAVLHPTEAGQQKFGEFLGTPAKRIAGVPVRLAANRTTPGKVRAIRLEDRSKSWRSRRGKLRVTWNPPARTNSGASIEKYQIRRTRSHAKGWAKWTTVTKPGTVYRKLLKSRKYRFQIRARNRVGWGEKRVKVLVPSRVWRGDRDGVVPGKG